ncbi:sensor histidine kinase [Nocardioides marmoriginsengisoli]|uniref:Sensor histidine kinase n=1 Tax=Nocardioides marmoriginsengisoli TaxID=661483 RepID=A0A3N0CLK5_9ACTN|nr:sensor histidine kinase [Nocardioides marmoriginsengisoli]RNL63793.1 sensor histidine kinase [Nocardioides marmoriginsengisoli]
MTSNRIDVDSPGGPRRWGAVMALVWLFYLLNPLEAGWEQRDTVSGWVGIVATVAFAGVYAAAFLMLRLNRPEGAPFRISPNPAVGILALAVEVVLGAVICAAVGQSGTATAVYLAVTSMICLTSGWAWLVTVLIAATTYAATLVVDGWHQDRGILFGILAAGLAIWGISQAINRSTEVLAVREENARLALDEERNRFARDLHDILGHSLTVITVKAELAQKLIGVDLDRAKAEVADLERLSRDALADVRRAVEGYRELTLPGEVARARTALQAAEIEADLPNSTEDVPSSVRELFAWTIREGVTNVIRHSRARTCTVRLTPTSVEVADDGVGPGTSAPGNGLTGLRERAAAHDGVVVTKALDPGFSLSVAVP